MVCNFSDINEWRREGKKIVFTNGCFDLLHPGHVLLLNTAASMGDKLVIGLNSDKSVMRLKGADRPIIKEEFRVMMLQELRCVDKVIVFDEDTPYSLIKSIKPDVLAKGGNYTIETVVGSDLINDTVIIALVGGFSTTKIYEQVFIPEMRYNK